MSLRPILISLSVSAGLSLTPLAAEPTTITLISEAQLDWVKTPEGVAFAPLEGDRFTQPYRAMVRLPAGISSPLHVKSANMFGVMIQGEMIHITEGQDVKSAQRMGVGSFYKVPKGLPHISACVSDLPCIAYLYQDGAFDFAPVAQ